MDTKIRKPGSSRTAYARTQGRDLIDVLKTGADRMAQWETAIDKWGIEFGGAFAIVFVVGMAIHQGQSVPMIAAAFGTVVAVLAAVFDEQHFNPFFTAQAFITEVVAGNVVGLMGLVSLLHVIWIWALQLCGSIAGAAALAWVFNSKQMVGATIPPDNINPGQIIFYEFIASFFYGMGVFSLSAQGKIEPASGANNDMRLQIVQKVTMPLTSGLSLFIATATIFPYTGASINFIRSVGPAIIHGTSSGLGYVFLGQLIGYTTSGCIFNMRCLMRKWANRKLATH